MLKPGSRLAACLVGVMLAGCASRAVDVAPAPASPGDHASWSCERIEEELDAVKQRAADVAYSVDERAGNNIIALGIGVTIFWPALLAMRPDGLEAAELSRLKGRFEALNQASHRQGCPPIGPEMRAALAARLPVAPGERLVYEDRSGPRRPASEWTLRLIALRRGEVEFELESAPGGVLLQDLMGNVVQAPPGVLQWPRLLRGELALGHVTGGEMAVAGDPLAYARMRGQVVAVGPQTVAGRRFEVAVVEIFGDALQAEAYTRVDGVIVVDRTSGVLLRLDLRSANPHFQMQRRLVRVERPHNPP
jgi:hypothetical protein